jgi:hypothetical protein
MRKLLEAIQLFQSKPESDVLADALEEKNFPKLASQLRTFVKKEKTADHKPTYESWLKLRAHILRAIESVHRSEERQVGKHAWTNYADTSPETRLQRAETIAIRVKRSSPAVRMRGEALDHWREDSLRRRLETEGLERYLPEVRSIVVRSQTQMTRESVNRRFVRAYGRGR